MHDSAKPAAVGGVDVGALSELLTAKLAAFLADAPAMERYRTPAELDAVLDRWEAAGARLRTLGTSKDGRPIRMALIGYGDRSLLAWGYPHPDEPMGAEALVWLGDGLLDGRLPDLSRWQVALVLCADPDEAARQRWLRTSAATAQAFAAGAWRPTQIGWMVDYGFPLDWGPFWQPVDYDGACRTNAECLARCGPGGCRHSGRPHAPLPESLALAAAIDMLVPDVVAAMHSTHTGGDYTFLLERERPGVLDAMAALPAACGTGRHLGEPLDRGRRWKAASPDLIREPSLQDFRAQLQRMPGFDPSLVYQRNHSAAAYVQAQGHGAQFICPESAMFRHPDFSDARPLADTVTARVSVEDRRRGRYEVLRVRVGEDWVIAHQDRAPGRPLHGPREREVTLTRGMLGVAALTLRRQALHAADVIWADLDRDGLAYHPYVEERARMFAPGAYVSDRSMLIFRVRADYRRAPTRAQAATLRWVWPLHTAALLSNFRNYLAAQDQSDVRVRRAVRALDGVQSGELRRVPDGLRVEGCRQDAVRSQLARVLKVMLARS